MVGRMMRPGAAGRSKSVVDARRFDLKIRRLPSVLFAAAILPLMPAAATAQETASPIARYDREMGVQYVASWEKGDHWGKGVLVQGGYRVCTLWGWQCQGIAEVMVVRFDDFNASYKQFALGVRLGKMMWPKIRTFAQLQGGVQNDGFENGATGAVVTPGIGFNYALTRRFDVQLLLDAPIAKFDRGTYNQARLGVGVGIPLGSH